MGDVINLRQARKAQQRRDREAAAARNRAAHGRTKTEKAREAAERAQADHRLDQHRRDDAED